MNNLFWLEKLYESIANVKSQIFVKMLLVQGTSIKTYQKYQKSNNANVVVDKSVDGLWIYIMRHSAHKSQ